MLVSNSESLAASGAGSSAIRFRADGKIAGAHRILSGTNANCAGGGTPWGRWLSCEEHDYGHVWECDPMRTGQGSIRPALGTFNHEAVAVDTATGALYMTEDRPDGGLYRFTPDRPADLRSGLLEVAVAAGAGRLAFAPVPDPAAVFTPTRRQVPGMRAFNGGEGIWYDGGTVHFSTKGDNRVWAYDTATGALGTIYDKAAAGPGAPLSGVDNLTVNPAGEVFVCEDGDDMQICVIAPDGTVAPFLQLTGEAAVGLADRGNELAGVIFDPSHRRLYFSAQRAYGFGAVYEVRGPFHGAGGAAPAGAAAGPAGGASPTACGCGRPSGCGSSALGAQRARARPAARRRRDGRRRRCARTSSGGCPASAARRRARTRSRWRGRGARAARRCGCTCAIGRAGLLRLRGRRSTRARITVVAPRPRRPGARRDARREDRALGGGAGLGAGGELGGQAVGDPDREVDRALGRLEVDGRGGVVGLVRAGGDAALVEAGDPRGGQAPARRGRAGAGGAAGRARARRRRAAPPGAAADGACATRARPRRTGRARAPRCARRSARSRRSCARSACGPDAPAP